MSTIRGTMNLFPRPEDYRPCVWCGHGTDSRMRTPGRPDLGEVPCHAGCAAAIVAAFDAFSARRRVDPGAAATAQLARLLRITAGG
jgi:hypothetical protein